MWLIYFFESPYYVTILKLKVNSTLYYITLHSTINNLERLYHKTIITPVISEEYFEQHLSIINITWFPEVCVQTAPCKSLTDRFSILYKAERPGLWQQLCLSVTQCVTLVLTWASFCSWGRRTLVVSGKRRCHTGHKPIIPIMPVNPPS